MTGFGSYKTSVYDLVEVCGFIYNSLEDTDTEREIVQSCIDQVTISFFIIIIFNTIFIGKAVCSL